MRSLLFVPGDSARKQQKGFESGADALILDLEDSVALEAKPEARKITLAFLKTAQALPKRPRLIVRVNALSTGLTQADLDVVMQGAPDAIMLPKSEGGADVGPSRRPNRRPGGGERPAGRRDARHPDRN